MKRLGRILLIGCALEGVLVALLYLFPPGTQQTGSLSIMSRAIAGIHAPATWLTTLFMTPSDWTRAVVYCLQALLWSALILLAGSAWRGKKKAA